MVNFRDPATVARDYLTLLKLWHAVDGIYIWEFFTTLDYEWSVIRGRRPYRWTIWVYSLARLATLFAVIVNMIGFNVSNPINCQAWVTLETVFAYTAFATASLLIVLRTIAIWNRNPIVIIMATGAWLTNVSFFIEGIVRVRAVWSPLQGICAVLNQEISRSAIVSTLANDMIMLLIMLVGLLRWRIEGGMGRMTRFLWTQGIIWLSLATVAEIPPSVFICLNLNEPYNSMFQMPALAVMSIAATRLYRSLTDFGSSNISHQDVFQSGPIVFETKQNPIAPISPNRMEMGLQTTSEQYTASQASSDGLYVISTEVQLGDKPNVLSLGDDVESGREI